MRQNITFVLLLGMLVGVGFLLFMRGTPLTHLATDSTSADAGSVTADGVPGSVTADGGVAVSAADGGAGVGEAEGSPDPEQPLDRPLRVVALGWDLIAPGIIANGGSKPPEDASKSLFKSKKLDVHFSTTSQMGQVEKALARGGADKEGADIAIVSLPTFVASYERLRALKPEIFFVVGWSRGREGLAAVDAGKLLSPPARGDINLRARRGAPASFMALFMLDQAGIDLKRVKLVDIGGVAGPRAPFAAIERAHNDHSVMGQSRKLLMTTADATHLIPFVAIAPAGFASDHAGALSTFSEVWLEGAQKLADDVPGAARQIAAEKNAPEVVDLLNYLGWIEYVGLRENVRLMGLSGRGAVTLEGLFHRTWRIWRGQDTLTTPSPEATPLANHIVANLARSAPALVKQSSKVPRRQPDGKSNEETILLRVRSKPGKLDSYATQGQLGFLAGVFGRSKLRLMVARDQRSKKTKEVCDAVAERFNVSPARLIVGKTAPKGRASAQIDVIAAQ